MTRHPTDLISLVPGLLFVAIAVAALAGGLTIDLLAADWVWPVVLIALGVLVLASAGLGRRSNAAEDAAADTPSDTSGVAPEQTGDPDPEQAPDDQVR